MSIMTNHTLSGNSGEHVEIAIERDDVDIWELLRRRIRWVFAIGLLGALAGGLYAFVGSPDYATKGEVLVIRKNPTLPASAANTTADVENDVTANLLSTHVEILKSTKIVQAGLRRHGLESLATIEKKRYSYESPTDYVIREMKVVHGGVESVDATANTIRASFTHVSSEEARQILSAVIESYMEFVAATYQDVSSDAVKLIEQAKSDLEGDLKRAETEYVTFLKEAPLYWSGEVSASGDKRQSIPQRRLELVEGKLADVRERYIEATTKLEVIEKALASHTGKDKNEFALAMLDSQSLQRLNFFADIVRGDSSRSEAFQADQSLRQQAVRAEYEKQLGMLLEGEAVQSKFGKNHWRTQELERQKTAMNEFLTEHAPQSDRHLKDSVPPTDVLSAYVEMLRSDAMEFKKRQEEYEQLSQTDIAAAKEIVNFEVRGEMLRQELDRKRKLHELVIDRLREMNLMKQYGGVVTELIAPVEKGKLKWLGLIEASGWVAVLLSIAAGTFVGCCMGVVLGVFRHLTDNTFGCDAEIQRELGLPILGHVDQDRHPIAPKMSGAPLPIAICSQPDSQSAEAYREMRDALLLARSRQEFNVLQISGATHGIDQAILASNLAAAFAEVGIKTLLVDCDLRTCAVSRIWGLSDAANQPGRHRHETDWSQPPHLVEVPGLSVLAIARTKQGLNESVFSASFKRMMEAAKKDFELVILSSPTILGNSDSLAVAAFSDVVLLSLRVARGKRGVALLARDSLTKFGIRIAGLVVTGADDKSVFGYRDLPLALDRLMEGKRAGAVFN